MSEDKKSLFLNRWNMLAVGYRPPQQEYGFDKCIGRKHRFDFAWVEYHIAVEVNGNAWQTKGGGRHGSDSDLEKMNIAASRGWRVFQFSPSMLNNDPVGCIDIIKNCIDEIERE